MIHLSRSSSHLLLLLRLLLDLLLLGRCSDLRGLAVQDDLGLLEVAASICR